MQNTFVSTGQIEDISNLFVPYTQQNLDLYNPLMMTDHSDLFDYDNVHTRLMKCPDVDCKVQFDAVNDFRKNSILLTGGGCRATVVFFWLKNNNR